MQSTVIEETGCILINKKPSSGAGYCQIRVNGKLRLAHVVAYELAATDCPDCGYVHATLEEFP